MKKKILILASAAACVALAGAAYAYWTTSGSGTGTATAGTNSTVNLVNATTPSNLYPGGPAQAIDFKLQNTGSTASNVSTITPTVTGTSDAGCTAADFTVTNGTYSGSGLNVPAGTTTGVQSGTGLTIKMDETGVDQQACKGVTVDLSFAVS
jgi:hypothetical protein